MATMMSHVTLTTENEAPCYFLRLPAELRNMIYEYAYPPESRLCYYKGFFPFERDEFLQPNISRVNKQIRAETLPIFYGTNTFILVCRTIFGSSIPQPGKHRWGWIASNAHLDKIRHIHIHNLEYPGYRPIPTLFGTKCELHSGTWHLHIQMTEPETSTVLPQPHQISFTRGSLDGQALEESLFKLLYEAVEAMKSPISISVGRPGSWIYLARDVVILLYASLHLSNLKMIISVKAPDPYDRSGWVRLGMANRVPRSIGKSDAISRRRGRQ